MSATATAAGRLRVGAPAAGALLVAGALALAALSLLAPSIPSYDPFAWIVWGREIAGPGALGMAGGPSWKPLPVLFTAVFSLFGGAAPALWLLVARAGALLSLAGAFALAARLAGRWAGLLAAVAVLLTDAFASLTWRGASEPLLMACVLWAIERHLAGRRGTAFALGVGAALVRPEAWPFLGLYALWRWRGVGARERLLLLGGLALLPLLWFGPPALAGNALAASSHAASYNGKTGANPGWTALQRGLQEAVAPVWVLALAAVALRPRDRVVRALALGAAAWLALVVAMTIAGYPGLARFMLPAAAVACVLAGVGAVGLIARAGRGRPAALAALVLLGACGALSASQASTLPDQVRTAVRAARIQHDLSRAIADLGGRQAVIRCAGTGAIAVNHTAQTALAWKLQLPLERVAQHLRKPGIDFHGPKLVQIGAPPPIRFPGRHVRTLLTREGVWHVVFVGKAGTPLPAACHRAV
jgi:hypothetical protein